MYYACFVLLIVAAVVSFIIAHFSVDNLKRDHYSADCGHYDVPGSRIASWITASVAMLLLTGWIQTLLVEAHWLVQLCFTSIALIGFTIFFHKKNPDKFETVSHDDARYWKLIKSHERQLPPPTNAAH